MANEGEQLKVAVAASGGWRIWARVLSMASKLSRSTTASHLPSGVGTSARGVRKKSGRRSQSSSCLTCWLTAPWVMHSSAAALVKLPWRAAASKLRSQASREGERRMSIINTNAALTINGL
ncbi:hypothetical protein D3C72_1865130 [compost metagenome]